MLYAARVPNVTDSRVAIVLITRLLKSGRHAVSETL
jgi:hypothetical protein